MKNDKYIQYDLEKLGVKYTAWLPEEFITSTNVDIKEDGIWTRDWKIIATYPNSVRTHEQILERSQDYKQTRKASDI